MPIESHIPLWLMALLGTGLYALFGAVPAHASAYQYTAVTETAKVLRQGTVQAGSLTWQCAGDRCTVRGPWPKPALSACKALARAVGPLRSYGHPGAMLSYAQLLQCNAGVPVVVPVVVPMVQATGSTGAASPDKRMKKPGILLPGTGGASVPSAGDGKYLSQGPEAATNEVVAETESPARHQGDVGVNNVGWSCSGSRCFTSAVRAGRGTSHAKFNCQTLARAVGRIKSFRWPGGQFNAEDIKSCNRPILSSIEFAVRSGEDDLRRNSRIKVEFIPDGEAGGWNAYPLFWAGVGKHVRSSEHVVFDRDTSSIRYGQYLTERGIKRIKVTFNGGSAGPFDTADNWDMNEMTVRAHLVEVDGRFRELTLVDLRGNPVHRFRDKDEWEVNVPPDALRR